MNNSTFDKVPFAELSGAYFGVAGALRSLAQIAGLSNVLVNLIALSSGALLSEFIKIRRRSIEPMRTRVGNGPTMYELMKFKQPNMNDLMKFRQNNNLDGIFAILKFLIFPRK